MAEEKFNWQLDKDKISLEHKEIIDQVLAGKIDLTNANNLLEELSKRDVMLISTEVRFENSLAPDSLLNFIIKNRFTLQTEMAGYFIDDNFYISTTGATSIMTSPRKFFRGHVNCRELYKRYLVVWHSHIYNYVVSWPSIYDLKVAADHPSNIHLLVIPNGIYIYYFVNPKNDQEHRQNLHHTIDEKYEEFQRILASVDPKSPDPSHHLNIINSMDDPHGRPRFFHEYFRMFFFHHHHTKDFVNIIGEVIKEFKINSTF